MILDNPNRVGREGMIGDIVQPGEGAIPLGRPKCRHRPFRATLCTRHGLPACSTKPERSTSYNCRDTRTAYPTPILNRLMKTHGVSGSRRWCLYLALAAGLPAAAHDARDLTASDSVARSVQFNSQALADKHPFGAVPAGTAVDFVLHAQSGVGSATLVVEKRRLEGDQTLLEYNEVARVPLLPSPDGGLQQWRGRYTFNEISVYGYYFELTIGGTRYVYQNNDQMVYWSREKGDNGLGHVDLYPTLRHRSGVTGTRFTCPTSRSRTGLPTLSTTTSSRSASAMATRPTSPIRPWTPITGTRSNFTATGWTSPGSLTAAMAPTK